MKNESTNKETAYETLIARVAKLEGKINWISKHKGGFISYVLGMLGFSAIFTLSFILTMEASKVFNDTGKYDLGHALVVYLLTFVNGLFCMGVIWVFRDFIGYKALKHVDKIEEERLKLETFFSGNTDGKSNEKGVINQLTEITKSLQDYKNITGLIEDQIVILASKDNGNNSQLKNFFKDDNIGEQIKDIDIIRFNGTGKGSMGNTGSSYHFFEELKEFLKKTLSNNDHNLREFIGIGAYNEHEQCCFRAFIYRIGYFLLKELNNDQEIKLKENSFKISFFFPEETVFPGQLVLGTMKSLINIPIYASETEVTQKTPIALQLPGSYNTNKNYSAAIDKCILAIEKKKENYNENNNIEQWKFTQNHHGAWCEVTNINKKNIDSIINKYKHANLNDDTIKTLKDISKLTTITFAREQKKEKDTNTGKEQITTHEMDKILTWCKAFGEIGYGTNFSKWIEND